MHSLISALIGIIFVSQPFQASLESPSLEQYQAYVAKHEGRWVADNAAYVSDQEAFTAYVTQWTAGPNNMSQQGRLFGIKPDGSETVNFWSFYEYWDPATKSVRVLQSGWQSVGEGDLRVTPDGSMVTKQSFTDLTGVATTLGHQQNFIDDDQYLTVSFDIDDKGEWVERRSYIWHRAKQEHAE